MVKVDPSTVRRLNQKVGQHGQLYHEQEVQDVVATKLQADERHGFAGNKQQPAWEAEVMNPQSKLIIAHVQGARTESLIGRLLEDSAARLRDRHQVTSSPMAWRLIVPCFPRYLVVPIDPLDKGIAVRDRLPVIAFPSPPT